MHETANKPPFSASGSKTHLGQPLARALQVAVLPGVVRQETGQQLAVDQAVGLLPGGRACEQRVGGSVSRSAKRCNALDQRRQ